MMEAEDFLLDGGPPSSPTDFLREFLKSDEVQPAKRARTEGVGIEALNESVWACVMGFLRWWDRAALSKTSHLLRKMRWAVAPPHVSLCDVQKGVTQLAHFLEIDSLVPHLQSLTLSGIQGMSASGEYNCFARLTALTRLEFIAFRFSSSPLQNVPTFPQLKELRVRHMVLSPRLLAWAARSPLQSLDVELLSHMPEVYGGLLCLRTSFIAKLPLRKLTLLIWDAEHLLPLRTLTALRSLSVSAPRGAPPLTTTVLMDVAHHMPQLEELLISPCEGFLPPFSSLPPLLTELSLTLSVPQTTGLTSVPCVPTALLSVFSSLTSLSTPHLHLPSDLPISSLLSSLTISNQRFRNGEITSLSVCSNLTRLALLHCSSDYAAPSRLPGLSEVTGLKHLRCLDLSASAVLADATIDDLSPLPNLRLLNLSNCPLLAPSLSSLSLPSLTELHLPVLDPKFYSMPSPFSNFPLHTLHISLSTLENVSSVISALPSSLEVFDIGFATGALDMNHLRLFYGLSSLRALAIRMTRKLPSTTTVDLETLCSVTEWEKVNPRLALLDLSGFICAKAAKASLMELRKRMRVLMPGFV